MTAPPKQMAWTAFATDLGFLLAPYAGFVIGALLGIGRDFTAPGNLLIGGTVVSRWALVPLLAGLGWMARLAYSYGKGFQRRTIVDLVGELEVSHIHSIPVEVEGQVIGRGVPGLFWSKDLVMQDETGFTTLIYRQPIGFLETLFGLFKAEGMIGRRGTFKGWYRRGPAPYIELSNAQFDDGQSVNCYYRTYLWVLATTTTVAGVLLYFARF